MARGTLHIECRMRHTDGFLRPDTVRDKVTEWLLHNFLHLRTSENISEYEGLTFGDAIESIIVVGFSGSQQSSSYHRLKEVNLDVQPYELHHDNVEDDDRRPRHDDELKPKSRITPLPSASIDGLWESLVYESAFPEQILRFATRMVSMTKKQQLDMNIVSWNHLILLHGPPGTGKSSLSRALAHKLTIRLGNYFLRGTLFEVDSQSLFSRYFGESGRLVGEIFEEIVALADDEDCLVCVLIDEVETLTSSREKAATGNECGDALRATNQLLTSIDALRQRPNVVIFCTSNMLQAIDTAFVDRVDIKQFVPNPCPQAVYQIFRTCINELIYKGVLVPGEQEQEPSLDSTSETLSSHELTVVEPVDIPPYHEMTVRLWDQPNAPARRLWKISKQAKGLSGRTLRRLPFLGLALHTYTEPSTIHEGLAALSNAVRDELYTWGLDVTSNHEVNEDVPNSEM